MAAVQRIPSPATTLPDQTIPQEWPLDAYHRYQYGVPPSASLNDLMSPDAVNDTIFPYPAQFYDPGYVPVDSTPPPAGANLPVGYAQSGPIVASNDPSFAPQQASSRPFRYAGDINFDLPGASYPPVPFASGGAGRGSAPYGEWPIQTYQQGAGANYGLTPGGVLQGWPVGTTPTGTMADPKYPGDPRDEIMIHAGRSDEIDQILSAGCLSIPQDQWPAFRDELRAAQQQYGPLVVVLQANGQATIRPASGSDRTVPPETFIAQSQARTSATTGGATSIAANVPMPNLRPDINAQSALSAQPPTFLGGPDTGATQPGWGWTNGPQMARSSGQPSPTFASYAPQQSQSQAPPLPASDQPPGNFVPDTSGSRFWWDQPSSVDTVSQPSPAGSISFSNYGADAPGGPNFGASQDNAFGLSPPPGWSPGQQLPTDAGDAGSWPSAPPPSGPDDFTPPDGQYADYWKGKTFNSANAPGFDPSQPTAYRDQFGDWSVPDSNDSAGQFSPEQLQQMFTPQSQPQQAQPAPDHYTPPTSPGGGFAQAFAAPAMGTTVHPSAGSSQAGNALLGFGGIAPSSSFLPKPNPASAASAWAMSPLGVPPKPSVFGASSWLPPKPPAPMMTMASAPPPPPPRQLTPQEAFMQQAGPAPQNVNWAATLAPDPWAQPGTDDTYVLQDLGGGQSSGGPGFNAFVYG